MTPEDIILDHYHHPKNFGKLEHATHHAETENLSCGDHLAMDIFAENDTIHSVGWTGTGCAVSQASASLLSQKIEGMSLADATAISKEDILSLLGIPVSPARSKCALLALETLRRALADKNFLAKE